VQCWLTEGQDLDEETQRILWTEWPTVALVGAGSFWPWKQRAKQWKLGENMKWKMWEKSVEKEFGVFGNWELCSLKSNRPTISQGRLLPIRMFAGKWFTCCLPPFIVFIGPCAHRDRDHRIESNFWTFYLIKTGFTICEPVSLVKVFRPFRLEWKLLVFRLVDTGGRYTVTGQGVF